MPCCWGSQSQRGTKGDSDESDDELQAPTQHDAGGVLGEDSPTTTAKESCPDAPAAPQSQIEVLEAMVPSAEAPKTLKGMPGTADPASCTMATCQHEQVRVSVTCVCAPLDVVWRDGFHTAPDLTPEVEECYKAALCSSQPGQYRDPATGYTAFTEAGLQARPTCCGNRCRHCPFGHFRSVRRGRCNHITAPQLLLVHSSTQLRDVTLLAVAAGQEELASDKLQQLGSTAGVVALVAVDPDSRSVWMPHAAPVGGTDAAGTQADMLNPVMDWCMQHRVPLLAVPVKAAAVVASGLTRVQVTGQVLQAAMSLLGTTACVKSVLWLGGDDCLPQTPWLQGLQTDGPGSWNDVLAQ